MINAVSMSKWHLDRITQVSKQAIEKEMFYLIFQRLSHLKIANETIDFDQYSSIMQLLDLNPNLLSVRYEIKQLEKEKKIVFFRKLKFHH